MPERRIACLHSLVALMNASCYARTFNVKVGKFVIELEHRNILQSIYNLCFFNGMSVCSSRSSGGSGFAATRSRDPTGSCTESWKSHRFVIRGNPCTGLMTGKPVAANWRNHEKPLDESWQYPQEIVVPFQLPSTVHYRVKLPAYVCRHFTARSIS